MVDKQSLDYVKSQIAAGAQPWTAAIAKTKASKYGGTSYTPAPVSDVQCGPYNNPNVGCDAENDDAHAAYTQALLWYYTGQTVYAQNAIKILDAWSSTLQQHSNSNAPLVSAWSGELFARGAEIIRYSGAGWSDASVARFKTMLSNVFVPGYNTAEATRAYQSGAGNWALSMASAKIAIGTFLDDTTTFNAGVDTWKLYVPAYIYQSSDGALPVRPPGTWYSADNKLVCHWLNRDPFSTSDCPATAYQTTFQNGQNQESCRDTVHAGLGFASMINAAETARIQHVDLYGQQQARIVSGLEFNAHIVNTVHSSTGYPAGYCTNAAAQKTPNLEPTFEIAYNQYAGRSKVSMPETLQLINQLRNGGGAATDQIMAWETLTHAGTYAAPAPVVTALAPTPVTPAPPTTTPTTTPTAPAPAPDTTAPAPSTHATTSDAPKNSTPMAATGNKVVISAKTDSGQTLAVTVDGKTVPVDSSGNAVIDTSKLTNGEHTVHLVNPTNGKTTTRTIQVHNNLLRNVANHARTPAGIASTVAVLVVAGLFVVATQTPLLRRLLGRPVPAAAPPELPPTEVVKPALPPTDDDL